MKRLLFLLLLFLTEYQQTCAQKNYGRRLVDTLAGEAMKGRGYVGGGDSLAARFIAAEFRTLGLLPYKGSYFHSFEFPVNTFPGKMSVELGGKALVPGVDFLVDPSSRGGEGTFSLVFVEPEDYKLWDRMAARLREAAKGFLVMDEDDWERLSEAERKVKELAVKYLKFSKEPLVEGVIFLSSRKLTWSVSTKEFPRVLITVKKEKVPENLDSVTVHMDQHWKSSHIAQNVLGWVKGKGKSDSVLVVSAHYDHLGKMGAQTVFPGANDNASGVAMLLCLARHFSEYPLEHDLLFAAFAGEEAGLIGASEFSKQEKEILPRIKWLLNLDMNGTGDDGITVVNGSVHQKEFRKMQELNQQAMLPSVKPRGEACNSDHCIFHRQGVKSFFIYTRGGIKAYHDIHDRPETLPLTKFDELHRLLVLFLQAQERE
ncbi:MAG: M28 family peptidase [Cytophagales bacterium]|nr:M28 family peptidase [Cytophagales bacterium]